MGSLRNNIIEGKTKMRFISLALVLCLAGGISAGKNRRPSSDTSSDTSTDTDTSDTDTTDTDTSSSDSAYATIVKAAIDAGQCASISSSSSCGDSAQGYYETFEYNGQRVIISSGAPSHEAESELYIPASEGGFFNPNTRCERWQYAVVPLNPTKASTYSESNMGSVGWVESGGVIYNHLSSPTGSLAAYYEIDTLDVCGGHSDQDSQYHYHLIPYCWNDSDDASACQFLGYMLDGFPVYGRCNHEGEELVSCWNQISGTEGSDESHFEFDSDGYSAGTCHLDETNGYTFSDGSYGYVLTDNIYQTPMGYYGTETGYSCGFTPSIA